MRVENWQLGDDVTASRSHKQDCKMMLDQGSGNTSVSKKNSNCKMKLCPLLHQFLVSAILDIRLHTVAY